MILEAFNNKMAQGLKIVIAGTMLLLTIPAAKAGFEAKAVKTIELCVDGKHIGVKTVDGKMVTIDPPEIDLARKNPTIERHLLSDPEWSMSYGVERNDEDTEDIYVLKLRNRSKDQHINIIMEPCAPSS